MNIPKHLVTSILFIFIYVEYLNVYLFLALDVYLCSFAFEKSKNKIKPWLNCFHFIFMHVLILFVAIPQKPKNPNWYVWKGLLFKTSFERENHMYLEKNLHKVKWYDALQLMLIIVCGCRYSTASS